MQAFCRTPNGICVRNMISGTSSLCHDISALVRLVCLVAALIALPSAGMAQTLYSSGDLTIPWPDGIARTDCTSQRLQGTNVACVQIGQDGQDGAVFVTRHPGYRLNRIDRLQKHLESSEAALRDIPNVRVMQSRILSEQPLVAIMEILRNDATISDIRALEEPPVRQTSLIIPIGDELSQIFIYLPLEGHEAGAQYQTLVETFTGTMQVDQKLDTSSPESDASAAPAGTLSLLPRALAVGIGLSLLIIGLLALRTYLARREKERRQKQEMERAERLDDIGDEPQDSENA